MISAFDIIFLIKGNYYLGGTVSASHDQTELFFHFPWGSRRETTIRNIACKSSDSGYLPDHFSFHRDGTVHSKGRDGRKKVQYQNKFTLDINPFNLPRNHFQPIYLESISLKNEATIAHRLKRVGHRPERGHGCWDVSDLSHFSLLLISMCERVNPQELLSRHGFELLQTVGSSHILANIFTAKQKDTLPSGCASGFDTRLLIAVVKQSWMQRPPENLTTAEMEPLLASVSVCMPPMEGIIQMRDLNSRK